jgi:predicted N-acetyltransferase YhbS
MWAPPGSAEALAEVDAVADPVAREISGDEGVRYHALWDWVESHRPGESHWYLDVLAVAAGRRGRGLGGALVRHGLTMAANERVPAFLVTSRASTAAFYARNGFAIIQQGFPPAGGPELWFMRWDP